MTLSDNLSPASRKRMAEIMRAKLRRCCANPELCESISDDDLLAQAEAQHERELAKVRARTMSNAVATALFTKREPRA